MVKKRFNRNNSILIIIYCIFLVFMVIISIEPTSDNLENPEIEYCLNDNVEESDVEEADIESTTESNTEKSDVEESEMVSDSIIPGIETATVLSSNERIVYSYAELQDALSNDNGITTVYLGSDITMQSGGAKIYSNKTEVQISGLDPTNPDQTTPYTLTEFDSNYTNNTISLASNGTLKKLLIKDLKITGKNYYGTFYIPDDSSNANLTIVYERVIYTGPQMVYHRYGTSHFIDCDITIAGTNLTNANQGFGEVGNLIFEGKNTLSTSTTSGNSVFYYAYITSSGTGSFEIKDRSSLTLIADNYSSDTDRGIFYTGGTTSAYGIDVTVGTGSELNIKTTTSLVGYSILLQANFKSFTVKQGGTFNLQTTTACSAVMYTTGAVTVADGAGFIVNSTGNGNSSGLILNQTAGNIIVGQGSVFQLTAAGTYSRLLQLGSGYKLECNDPASVLLYNSGGRVVQSASGTCGLSINAQQVNYWTAASPGGFENLPLYHWENASENMTISANVGTAGATSNVSHNYAGTEYDLPNSTTFSMASARVLSFGRLELIVAVPDAGTTGITGITAPGATVRVSFGQKGIDYFLPDVTADSDGVFHIDTGVLLEANTVVTVKSDHQYLNAATEVTVSEQGTLGFTIPVRMEFYNTEITSDGNSAKRLDPDWHIVVSDTRGTGSEWSIYVRLLQPLTPSDNTKPVLTEALVFVNNSITSLTSERLFVYHHVSTSDNEVTKIHWAEDRGILIQIPINITYSGLPYTGVIEWTLVDAP